MQLWQLDLIELPLANGAKIRVLTGVDDHSRYCVSAAVLTRAIGRAVCRALAAVLGRYGVPEEVLTDNGKQFTGRFGKPEVLFERILRENGITHRLTRVRAPTTSGKVERFHQTLRKELLATLPPLPSAEVAQQVLDAWVEDYNQRRPHQALGGQTPAERFHAKPDHLDQDGEAELPLWLPAALDQEHVGMAAAEPVQLPTPSTATAELAAIQPAPRLPLEVDAQVPACGNLGVAGRQVWLGRRLAGRRVQVRLDGATMHVSLDGRLLKTLPCPLQPQDLHQGRLQGARPAGPAPFSTAAHAVLLGPGDAVEVARRVNAGGTVGSPASRSRSDCHWPGRRSPCAWRRPPCTCLPMARWSGRCPPQSRPPPGPGCMAQGWPVAPWWCPPDRWWSATGSPSAARYRSPASGSRSGSPMPARS
jgi:hypothetical protein